MNTIVGILIMCVVLLAIYAWKLTIKHNALVDHVAEIINEVDKSLSEQRRGNAQTFKMIERELGIDMGTRLIGVSSLSDRQELLLERVKSLEKYLKLRYLAKNSVAEHFVDGSEPIIEKKTNDTPTN